MTLYAESEAGFTLLEMLIALAIIGLAAAVAVPSLMRPSDGMRLGAAVDDLKGALRATRSAAIVTNAETTLVIDVDKRRVVSTAGYSHVLAPDIEAKLTFASAIRPGQSEGGFRYFPDGSSTGGDVTLSLHGLQTRLCVDWLTGQVRSDRC